MCIFDTHLNRQDRPRGRERERGEREWRGSTWHALRGGRGEGRGKRESEGETHRERGEREYTARTS